MRKFLVISITFSLLYFGLNNVSFAGSGTECTTACTNDCPVIKGVAQQCVRNKKTNKCSCQNPSTMEVDEVPVDVNIGDDFGSNIQKLPN